MKILDEAIGQAIAFILKKKKKERKKHKRGEGGTWIHQRAHKNGNTHAN